MESTDGNERNDVLRMLLLAFPKPKLEDFFLSLLLTFNR